MTAAEYELWVREVVEPMGIRVLSDDGICVFRADSIDGYYMYVRYGELGGWIENEHTATEEHVKADARGLADKLVAAEAAPQ